MFKIVLPSSVRSVRGDVSSTTKRLKYIMIILRMTMIKRRSTIPVGSMRMLGPTRAAACIFLLPCIVSALSRSTNKKCSTSSIATSTAPSYKRRNVNDHETYPLRLMAVTSAKKRPGSLRYLRTWRLWSEGAIDLLRAEVVDNLPTPVDREALQALSVQLGMAAEGGSMPSFEDEGARAGYAVDYFSRAQLAADLLFISKEEPPPFWVETVRDIFGGQTAIETSTTGSASISSDKICRMVSLGGGPGFDYVATALIATFAAQRRNCVDSPLTTIHATVLDYELGWESLVEAMATSIDTVLAPETGRDAPHHTCNFGGCDITLPLSDTVNAPCANVVEETDLWVCSYCVAENAVKLRKRDFVFFQDLFANSKVGSLFLFTETTHRLWPDLARVASMNDNVGFHVAFPRRYGGKGKLSSQLILQKREGPTILGVKEQEQCHIFERDNAMQERKILNGSRRILRKIPGAK